MKPVENTFAGNREKLPSSMPRRYFLLMRSSEETSSNVLPISSRRFFQASPTPIPATLPLPFLEHVDVPRGFRTQGGVSLVRHGVPERLEGLLFPVEPQVHAAQVDPPAGMGRRHLDQPLEGPDGLLSLPLLELPHRHPPARGQ